MKKIVFIAGLAIVVAGLTSFVIINRNNEGDKKKSQTEKTTTVSSYESLPGKAIAFGTIYPSNMDLSFRVSGKNDHPVTKEKLGNANLLNDIIDYYPENWVEEYESVEISADIKGVEQKANSSSQVLNNEQKRILQSAALASDIHVKVKYKTKNSVTNKLDDNQMDITMTVIPEKEAEYKNGYNNLIQYLKENSKNEMSGLSPDLLEPAYIWFTVNEYGKTEDIDLKKSCGYPKIDKLMYELIRDMPEWKPAENSKGEKVKQNFELAFGGIDGC